jgi:hypothetical protein
MQPETGASKSDYLLSFRNRPMASESLSMFLPFSRAISSPTIFRSSISVLLAVSGCIKLFGGNIYGHGKRGHAWKRRVPGTQLTAGLLQNPIPDP